MAEDEAGPSSRERVVAAAHRLLVERGRTAVTTRAVCAAAGVQPPTIYRLFGDKDGLLDAVATAGWQGFRAGRVPVGDVVDPAAELRAAWDVHVGFGRANPYLYSLMFGQTRPGRLPPSAVEANRSMAHAVGRLAEAGLLRVSEPRATAAVCAAACGTTFRLISAVREDRDSDLSTMAREGVIATLTHAEPVTSTPGPAGAAVALRALLARTEALDPRESALLEAWLDRIIDHPTP